MIIAWDIHLWRNKNFHLLDIFPIWNPTYWEILYNIMSHIHQLKWWSMNYFKKEDGING